MPYIPGVFSIERVIRPGAVQELLCLKPDSGGKSIVFDLDIPLRRSALCDFIKECDVAKCVLTLEENGAIKIPAEMETRFEFYREFYGLTRWAVLGVEILQTGQTGEKPAGEKKSSDEGTATITKIDADPPPPPKKKPKTFRKLEARPLNIIPSSIVWVAGSGPQEAGPKKHAPTGPAPLTSKLGMHKVGVGKIGLGRPATGLKSLGGFGGFKS